MSSYLSAEQKRNFKTADPYIKKLQNMGFTISVGSHPRPGHKESQFKWTFKVQLVKGNRDYLGAADWLLFAVQQAYGSYCLENLK